MCLAMFDMHNANHKSHVLRVMLRGYGKNVQRCFLEHDYTSRDWVKYCSMLFASVMNHEDMPIKCESCVYMMWGRSQKTFYVGKASV